MINFKILSSAHYLREFEKRKKEIELKIQKERAAIIEDFKKNLVKDFNDKMLKKAYSQDDTSLELIVAKGYNDHHFSISEKAHNNQHKKYYIVTLREMFSKAGWKISEKSFNNGDVIFTLSINKKDQ